MRIVVHCPDYFVGVNSVFKHGENLGFWEIEKDKSKIKDSDYLIIGAFDNSYNDAFLKRANAVLLTSTLGQMELSNEFIPFTQALNRLPHLRIFCGHQDSCAPLSLWLGKTVEFMPYPIEYAPAAKTFSHNSLVESSGFKVGLFLPSAPRKNMLNQVSAFYLVWQKLQKITLHTNNKIEGINVRVYDWLSRKEYLEVLNSLDFNLHVTFTESLSYGVVDSINQGVLPIVSYQISEYFGLPSALIIKNTDSAIDIAHKIYELSQVTNSALDLLLHESRIRLKVVAEMNNEKLRSLTETLDLV